MRRPTWQPPPGSQVHHRPVAAHVEDIAADYADQRTEIAERILHEELDKTKDPRKAYGEMAATTFKIIKAFRDLAGRHVVMTCKTERVDGGGSLLWAPNLPGRQLSQGISYLFDEVFALRAQAKDDGGAVPYLQTVNDGYYEAKDRSGALAPAEPANLSAIVAKIQNTGDDDNG